MKSKGKSLKNYKNNIKKNYSKLKKKHQNIIKNK